MPDIRGILAVTALTVLGAAHQARTGQETVLPLLGRAPVVDGTLGQGEWSAALALSGFSRPNAGRPPAKETRAWIGFDDKALYVAFRCAEPKPEQLRTQARPGSDEVWKDDCVEIWLRTTDSSLEHDQFIVSARGLRQAVRRRQRTDLPPWKPDWQAAARIGKDHWSAEVRIPFASLDLPAAKPGTMLELKLGREDHTGKDTQLSVWPAGTPYAGTEGFHPVYLQTANLLANPAMAETEGDRIARWNFHKGDAGRFASVTDEGRQVIRFRTPGRYSTASQSVRLVPHARYRLQAKVKGTAGVYLRARTVLKKGAASTPHTVTTKPSKQYVAYSVPFVTGPDGKALILIGNTEEGGKGEVFVADLAVVRERGFETYGPAIPHPGGDTVLEITKLPIADCRSLRGFLGTPVDGTTASRGWGGGVWEYGRGRAGAGTGYSYRNSDGLHITFPQETEFQAVLIRGGIRGKLYRDCPKYDSPEGGTLLAEFPGRTRRCRVLLARPARTHHVSFFDVTDGHIADVSFYQYGHDPTAREGAMPYGASAVDGASGPIDRWMEDRFEKADRSAFLITHTYRKPAGLRVRKGQSFHLVSRPVPQETALSAVGLDLRLADAPTPMPLTLTVQDPLNPRAALMEADLVLADPSRCRVRLDFPDQIVPKGSPIWLTVTAGAAARVQDMRVDVRGMPRTKALPQALAYRKLLLKTYFCALSEARPWMRWYDDRRMAEGLADKRWGPQLRELVMTLDQCRRLGPDDDLVRQYYEWVYQNHRERRKTFAPFEPRIDKVPGAPRWAVVARQAWRTAREVPRWWIDHRMVANGELGGLVGDDTDMLQNYADFPVFETGGVAGQIRDCAERLMATAERENLTAGLNRRTMDPLHAYEEGVNHLALLGWWNYGDPVAFERCLVSARSTEALTVVTPKGHRHFKSQSLGAVDLTTDRKTDVDGHAHPLMWHPTLEVAWYNHNPRALRNLKQWADGWLAHMRPGKYATSVRVADEKVVETTHRPLYGGYGSLGSAMLFVYWITGDQKYLGPFFEAFAKGSRNTSPHLILPELLHRHGLAFLSADKRRDLVRGEGAAETIVTGDKKPLIDALTADIAELQRFPAMYTTAEPYTDRVFLYAIRNAAIAYTGGYASRNKLHHTHAVSWEGFGTDYAALVLRARPDTLKVLVYNFRDKPVTGRMRVWTLDHGRYRMHLGTDADGDDHIDGKPQAAMLTLHRASPVALTLPPAKVTVLELTQTQKLPDIRTRADLALSTREIRLEDGKIHGVLHNIGSAAAQAPVVALLDPTGRMRAKQTLPPLEAPLDLLPRRAKFTLAGLPAGARGWSVAVDPEKKIEEIYEGNNRVPIATPSPKNTP